MLELLYMHYFWLSLIASALNSATIAVVAGFATKADHGTLIALILLLTVGSHLISFIYFFLGKLIKVFIRKISNRFHFEQYQKKIEKVSFYIKKYQTFYIFMYRFLPGLRFISPYIIGVNSERYLLFFIVDFFASFIWAIIFGTIGYLFGAVAIQYLNDFHRYDIYIYAAIVFIVIIAIVIKFIKYVKHSRNKP